MVCMPKAYNALICNYQFKNTSYLQLSLAANQRWFLFLWYKCCKTLNALFLWKEHEPLWRW